MILTHSWRGQNHKTQKARDDPRQYEYHDGYKICTRDDYENSRAYNRHAAKKEKIMCKFGLEDLKFDGYLNFRIFSDWLADMGCYFDC